MVILGVLLLAGVPLTRVLYRHLVLDGYISRHFDNTSKALNTKCRTGVQYVTSHHFA